MTLWDDNRELCCYFDMLLRAHRVGQYFLPNSRVGGWHGNSSVVACCQTVAKLVLRNSHIIAIQSYDVRLLITDDIFTT